MLTFRIDGDLITADQYMARHGVSYFRAIHEINKTVNEAAMTAVEIPDIPASLDRRKPKPLVYSYTLLDTFENVCPHQAYRRYVKKDIKYVESGAARWGNQVHTALEYRLGGKPLPPEMQQWEPLVEPLASRKATAEQKLGITKGANPCGFFDDGVWFRGKIDVTLIEGETAYINDWKTGKSSYESPFELETNALLLHARYPHLKKIVGSYTWLAENRIGQMYDLSDTNAAWHRVCDLVDKFEIASGDSGGWEKRRSGLCGWCDVLDCEHNRKDR